MSRFARTRRVFFFEEPVFEDGPAHLRSLLCPKTGVNIVTPVLPHGLARDTITRFQAEFLNSVLEDNEITEYVAWYYTPMALEFSPHLRPEVTVYDCMDELSAFTGAPAAMRKNEAALFHKADLVFTGGASLYESKRKQHASVHRFPSSVDVAHFAQARSMGREPDDQAKISRPRLGYAGVIDERMDLELIRAISSARPEWQMVMLGPVVKIDAGVLPQAENIHYLGMKPYSELPAYFSGWDIGMLPFALNDSTRFISPTKTPEYLAAGLPVVSAPIRDVISPYGDLGLVQIANGPSEFASAADLLLQSPRGRDFQAGVDQFLSQSSWDKTWSDMNQLIENELGLKHFASASGLSRSLANVGGEGASNV